MHLSCKNYSCILKDYCHYLLHHLNGQYLSIMFDIFIIALVWMYDHALTIMPLYFCMLYLLIIS